MSRSVIRAPAVVSTRGMALAIRRALPPRAGIREPFGAYHGITATDLSRATDERHPDCAARRRVAEVLGYAPHPVMRGHYRRVAEPAGA